MTTYIDPALITDAIGVISVVLLGVVGLVGSLIAFKIGFGVVGLVGHIFESLSGMISRMFK
jgi:hypothetical protein